MTVILKFLRIIQKSLSLDLNDLTRCSESEFSSLFDLREENVQLHFLQELSRLVILLSLGSRQIKVEPALIINGNRCKLGHIPCYHI